MRSFCAFDTVMNVASITWWLAFGWWRDWGCETPGQKF